MKPADDDVCMELSYSHLEADEYPNMKGNKRWAAVSTHGQDLVLKMMQRDPKRRVSAAEVRPRWLCCTARHRKYAVSIYFNNADRST